MVGFAEHLFHVLFGKTVMIGFLLNCFIAKVPLWKCILLWLLGSSSKLCWEFVLRPWIEPIYFRLYSIVIDYPP